MSVSRRRFLGSAVGSVALPAAMAGAVAAPAAKGRRGQRLAFNSLQAATHRHFRCTRCSRIRSSGCRSDRASASQCLRQRGGRQRSGRDCDQRLDHRTMARARPREHGEAPGCGKGTCRASSCSRHQQRRVGLVERGSHRLLSVQRERSGNEDTSAPQAVRAPDDQPVGNHPIVRGLEPFKLPWDETFPNMWISPRATVLLESDDPSFNNPAVAWVGPHQKARVVCMQPGHTRHVCQDPTIATSSTGWFCGQEAGCHDTGTVATPISSLPGGWSRRSPRANRLTPRRR